MNKAPKCKLCGFQHWQDEPHGYPLFVEAAPLTLRKTVRGKWLRERVKS